MALLGPDGLPINKALLSKEIAAPTVAGVRRIHEERVATGLTPDRLGRILRDAQDGNHRDYLTLAEEMEERYMHYASQLQTRRLAIEGTEFSLDVPAGVPAKIADFVTSLKEDPEFLSAAAALTDGIAKGYSVVEMMWEYQEGALRPVQYEWRDPRFFQFDRLSGRQLRLAVDGSIDGEDLPQGKFLRHVPQSRMGLPVRRGVARIAAWAFIVQSFALQDWAAFAEVYGLPLRVGKYHAAATEAEKRTLLRAVASIANDAAAIIPDGMEIDFHEVTGSRGEAVFGGLLDYIDRNISKVVVGQTMTADDGASLGQAKIHNEVRLDILRADCRQEAITIGRDLIRVAVDLNYGPQAVYPTLIRHVADPEDVAALSEAVAKLVPQGLRVSQRQMLEKLGLSEPGAGEDILAPAAAAPAASPAPAPPPAPVPGRKPARLAAHVDGCRCGGCLRTALLAAEPAAERDGVAAVDRMLEEALAEWQDITDPLLAPLGAALAQATSFEQVLAILRERGPDATRLAERLAIATATARGIGDVMD
jgi:phage gp29-like protein